MKRALLIVGGTVGGLGAVLSITPPQINSSTSVSSLPGVMPAVGGNSQPTPAQTQTSTPTPTPAQTASHSATPAATKKAVKKSTATKNASVATQSTPTPSATPSQSQSSTPTAAPAQTQSAAPAPAPATKSGVTGSFTGTAVNVGYGIVQVKITVANGKITDAQAVQAPNGRNDRFTQMSVPVLRQRTLAAQGSNISGVSGASYTSYGWYTSLVSALKQAGL
jgi:uncharacterized protein with FMN-binding domain